MVATLRESTHSGRALAACLRRRGHWPLSTNFREFPLCEVRAPLQVPGARVATLVISHGNSHMLMPKVEQPTTLRTGASGDRAVFFLNELGTDAASAADQQPQPVCCVSAGCW